MIRKAKKEDKEAAAQLLYDALHDIGYQLTGAATKAQALAGLAEWFGKPGNRISYENTLVKEIDGQAVGLVIYYHGSRAEELDRPIVEHLRRLHEDQQFTLDKETDSDEWYIDTLSVTPAYQRLGYATELIKAVEEIASQKALTSPVKVALNVEPGNLNAYHLYQRRGYAVDKEITINKNTYLHMSKCIPLAAKHPL
ncbi:GNAT family N-acetyltransferase [Brevibacillus migulae]|uniref:GNAT family N-acetyltransferase n=1 Tax=Brevibacillus migulae TaxID=1644114 RepID=UPI00106E6E76|nr:GNAT family N-acetyltransferase [Brevibacillus migulae]